MVKISCLVVHCNSPNLAFFPWKRSAHFRKFSIFNKIVDNLKKEAAKDKELESSLQLFKQKLTQFNESETIKSAKEFINKAKDEVLEKNQAIVDELRKKTEGIRHTSAKIVDPIRAKLRTDPHERKKRIAAMRLRLKQQSSDASSNVFERDSFQRIGRGIRQLFVDEASSSTFGTIKSKNLREKNKSASTASDKEKQTIAAFPPTESKALIHIGDSTHSFFDKVKDSLRQSVVCRRIWKLEQFFNHSNNIFVFFLRSIVDRLKNRLSSMFRESEQAKCIVAFRSIAPSFSIESFLRDCREFIIPDVIESFLNNDLLRLKSWTSEGTYNILKANLNAMKKPGCVLDGQLFDLRNVDMAGLKMLEDKPVIIVSFQTQQIMVLRNEKSGELVEGDEEKLERYEYVFAFTMNEFLQLNTAKDKADGWRIIELAIRKV